MVSALPAKLILTIVSLAHTGEGANESWQILPLKHNQ
jgi:hypothetical protein